MREQFCDYHLQCPAAYWTFFIHEFHCCIRHFINYVNVNFLIMHQIASEINETTLFLSKLNLASEKVCPKKCVQKRVTFRPLTST
jgi:hypothetical protein